METISVICPTRNRPELLRRLWQSAKDTASVMPEFCTYIDDDDTLSVPVCEELGIKYRQGPQKVYTQNYNEAAEVSTGSILFDVADDFIFRESKWDLKVIAEFDKVPDKLILVHGFDGTEGAENATHFFVHRHWVNILGYLFPPYFRWANADVWMTKVAKLIDRQVYLPTMLVEHMHLCQGKAPVDSTYAEASERIRKYAWADIAGYHSLEDRKADIEADAEKLRQAIQRYK
jgi:Glycosyl transferase family 2